MFRSGERMFRTAECTYRSGEHNSNIGFTYIYNSLSEKIWIALVKKYK